jgi:hypothetical protein
MANEERCDNDEIAMATSIESKLVLREKGASLLDHVRKTWLGKTFMLSCFEARERQPLLDG